MIPRSVTVRLHRPDGRRRRLYVPVLPVLLVLSPLVLLVALAGVVACLATRIPPLGALRAVGGVLWALPGTLCELEWGRTAVRLDIR
ncbi:hypothetical protein ACSMX9_05525 [Streptomyces sp. LE64]|uniref:hypothetical protein n=1 Tax=Streptomyces sp. LE64 TaxID=3448653 RepID=UPI004042177B